MVKANQLLFLCAVWTLVLARAQDQTLSYNSSDISSVTLFIVREHISRLSTTLVAAEYRSTPDASEINARILHNLLSNLDGKISVQLYLGDDKLQLWEYYILIVDSVIAFKKLQFRFPQNYFERRFNFVIILTNFTRDLLRVMRRIFTICYMFHVIDVTLLVDDPQLGVCLYTYKLFSPDKCQIIQPELQYTFSQGFDNVGSIFPKKIRNMHRCPLRVILRNIPPQVIFTGNHNRLDAVDIDRDISGIEGELLKLIADTMNFTIRLLPFMEEHYSPTYFDELKGGRADVAVGAFSASDPNRWVTSPTVQYHQSPYVYIVRLGHVLESFDRLTRPFMPRVWVLLGLLLVGGTVVIFVVLALKPAIRRFIFGAGNETPLNNFFAVFLGYPISVMPRRNFARFLLCIWLLISFVLRSAYQCALYDAIRLDKFFRAPAGYNDLMKWNFTILMSRDIADLGLFESNSSAVIMQGNYASRIQAVTTEHTKRLAAVVLMDNYFYHISRGTNFDSHVHVINEVIYMYRMVMYFPKHSIFVTPFNEKLQVLTWSGITQALCSTYYSSSRIIAGTAWENVAARGLANDRLVALYRICSWGLILAAIVFVLEFASRYSVRVRAVADWIQ